MQDGTTSEAHAGLQKYCVALAQIRGVRSGPLPSWLLSRAQALVTLICCEGPLQLAPTPAPDNWRRFSSWIQGLLLTCTAP